MTDQAWDRFLAALEPLHQAGKLGAILLQFPPWFPISRGRKDYIVACAERVAPRRVCIEFRNRTWMTEDNQKETLDFLAAHRLPYVSVDMPQGYRLHSPGARRHHPDLAVVRLHGHSGKWDSKDIHERFGYHYSDRELQEWAPRVAAWPTARRPRTWCSTTATGTTRRPTRSSSLRCSKSEQPDQRAAEAGAGPGAGTKIRCGTALRGKGLRK